MKPSNSSTFPLLIYSLTVFICGYVILSLEILGFRLLSPYFGYSSYVWGALIGIIMTTLSLGYYLGGMLADKTPRPALIFDMILCSAIFLIPILFFYKKILTYLLSYGIILGSLLSTVTIFAFPMLLLSMVSPFAIKLLAKEDTVGITAGKIYAISTAGSVVGTFLTSFVLIPYLGSFSSLTIMIIILTLLYILGNKQKIRRTLLGVILIILVLLIPESESGEHIIDETESAYNIIRVGKKGDVYTLYLNDERWVQSTYRKGFISTGGYMDFMLLGKPLTDINNLLILGAGGGTSIKQFLFFSPEAQIDAVEIDPKVIEAARKYFGLADNPRLKIHFDDARPFLNRTQKKYDVIEIDMFSGGPFVPFYLTTQEFFQMVFKKLNSKGLMLTNVLNDGRDGTLVFHIGNTAKTIFSSVFTIDLKKNVLLIAFEEKISLKQVKLKLKNNSDQRINKLTEYALENIKEFQIQNGYAVFTDDKAPIEKITYEMVKDMYN